MVNERYDDKYEGHEEGEYHFSDDQANYEMDADLPKGTPAATLASPSAGLAGRFNSRKIVIGAILFIVVLAAVYKMLVPTSTTPDVDFSPQAPPPLPAIGSDVAKPMVPKAPAAASNAVTTPPPPREASPMPVASQPMPPQPAPTSAADQGTFNPTAVSPPNPMATDSPAPVPAASMPEARPVVAQQQPPVVMAPAQPDMTVSVRPQPPANINQPPPQGGNISDRISALEQREAAIVGLLETQYTQKSESEAQGNDLRNKIQEVNTRLAGMETALRQLTQAIHGGGGKSRSVQAPSSSKSAAMPMRAVQPKMSYTVQAIIPGRAWLKSDSGETVTVAEGDVLKGYGRVTRIDPYDGIVNIDMSGRVITLSYGSNGG